MAFNPLIALPLIFVFAVKASLAMLLGLDWSNYYSVFRTHER